MTSPQGTAIPHSAGWRFNVGIAIICVMAGSWLMVLLLAAIGMPTSKIVALSGGLFISNKVLLVLAIAIMGRSGFELLKRRLFGYASLLAPRSLAEVGPTRHKIGIFMFCLPLITSFLEPYIDNIWPGLRPNLWELQILGDAMFIASFFVLGGGFWEKARALFIRTQG